MLQRRTTRLRPLAALRALRALLRDKEDTRQVFLLIDALRGTTTMRQLARFRLTEIGQRVLVERRRLLDRLGDRARLAALPQGTLGRAYHDFLAAEGLSAQGLVAASRIREQQSQPALDDETLFRDRNREMHDLLHIVTGYGRDPLGEVGVLAFTYAQTGQKGQAVIAIVGALRIARHRPGEPVRRAVFEAYCHGRKAGWLVGADWEDLLARPVEAIRKQFHVESPIYYPQIVASARDAHGAANAPAIKVTAAG